VVHGGNGTGNRPHYTLKDPLQKHVHSRCVPLREDERVHAMRWGTHVRATTKNPAFV